MELILVLVLVTNTKQALLKCILVLALADTYVPLLQGLHSMKTE